MFFVVFFLFKIEIAALDLTSYLFSRKIILVPIRHKRFNDIQYVNKEECLLSRGNFSQKLSREHLLSAAISQYMVSDGVVQHI